MQNSQNKELVSHYLKMNNILSNALKNTEATEQTKFYKLSETDFKSKFESHLKTTGCDTENPNFTPDVCLTDGSQFKYGTFDESCTDNICDTLTIDTNGKKGPNTAGKDRFTINLTPNGLKALGESDTCENGLDCGAYILAHHKLWTGEVTLSEPEPIVANCNNIEEKSCTKCKSGFYVENGECKVAAKFKLSNGKDVYISDSVAGSTYSPTGKFYHYALGDYADNYWQTAVDTCSAKGMTLPDIDTLQEIYTSCGQPGFPDCNKNYWSGTQEQEGYTALVYINDGTVWEGVQHTNIVGENGLDGRHDFFCVDIEN